MDDYLHGEVLTAIDGALEETGRVLSAGNVRTRWFSYQRMRNPSVPFTACESPKCSNPVDACTSPKTE
jgi:hypothetical protein